MEKITVRVKPGSRKGPLIEKAADGSLVVYVREQAVEGKANEAVVKVLAEHFDVPKSKIQLVAGQKSKIKHFEIQMDKG